MNIQDGWEKALKYTEIVRSRVQPLSVSGMTQLPYVFLAESALNVGDTVVRKGEVFVEKPSIILPSNSPQFEGFELEKEFSSAQDFLMSFLLVRGIRFPSLKYSNKTESLDIFEGSLKKAVDDYEKQMQQKEDVHAGLVIGPEDCWQLSVLILICSQILRQADGDIKKLLDEFHKGRE